MATKRRDSVFYISLIIFVAFAISGALWPQQLDVATHWLHERLIRHFGWGYLIAAFFFLVASIAIALSRYGDIKLGADHEKPYYSFFGWLSMLFAAGMGIGMIFWGVAEPMSHFLNPPENITAQSGDAAEFAMRYSFFHWGLHPWAIYIIMSLAIAYFSFRRGMPPLISSCFYPLVGDKIYGSLGRSIDILAVFATVFGIVTSLGLGAMQITSGLGAVFNFEASLSGALVVIAVVTVLFLISSISGLDKGIQILSKANMALALSLLSFMFLVGPSTMILEIFTNTISDYLTSLVDMSLSTNPFQGREWTRSWTLFYWAWWISWSPFVGMFVASISRGRTIREFVVACLIVPPTLSFIWFSVFAGAAFHLELEGPGGVAAVVAENVSTGLFSLYEFYPLGPILSIITVLLLVVFFVTSADSATFVLAMMTSNGKAEPPMHKKIIWGITVALTAGILLNSGGLEALKRLAVAAALPFTVLMLLLCWSLLKGLGYEAKEAKSQSMSSLSPPR